MGDLLPAQSGRRSETKTETEMLDFPIKAYRLVLLRLNISLISNRKVERRKRGLTESYAAFSYR